MNRRTFLASCAAGAVAPLAAAPRNIMERYQAGINLGTWISQYQNQKPPEWDTRVREHDVAQIASWGMDHIRLPIDHDFFEQPARPGEYIEERLAYADRAMEWARKNGLNVILDLHRAPGYFFGDVGKNKLFTEPAMRDRFVRIWTMFAKRYKSQGENLIFELLNEVVEATPAEWDGLVASAVKAIRAVDRDRYIMVGGRHYNSINALKDIAIVDDPRMVYTFHFYEPILFTHQKAGWNKSSVDYDKLTNGGRIEYPGPIPRVKEFADAYPEHRGFARLDGVRFDRDWMVKAVQPAVDFLEANNKPLYCGEYGVIRHASEESKERWYDDFCGLLREHRIARAAWSYKDGAFGFVDRESGKPHNMGVVKLAAKKW